MFRFKQFSVAQERSAMKVCTDSCLFGGLVEAKNAKNILDIGTGTGLLALMLAQKNNTAKLTAVEIDNEAFNDAEYNFSQSKFGHNITAENISIQAFQQNSYERFDLIVSNPPFYENQLKSAKKNKNIAHHAESLSFDELIEVVEQLLIQDGSFWVMLPPHEMQIFTKKCNAKSIFVNQNFKVKHKPNSAVIREICHLKKHKINVIFHDEICVYNADNKTYNERFVEILGDYYLNF